MTLRGLMACVHDVAYPYAPVQMDLNVVIEVDMYDDNGKRLNYQFDMQNIEAMPALGKERKGQIIIRAKNP